MRLISKQKAPWQTEREAMEEKKKLYIVCLKALFPAFWIMRLTNYIAGPAPECQYQGREELAFLPHYKPCDLDYVLWELMSPFLPASILLT